MNHYCFTSRLCEKGKAAHRWPAEGWLTRGLEVEGHQLAATDPHGQWVIVGGVEALPLGVDATQLPAVVLQEFLALAAIGVLLRLGLRKGRHVPVTGFLGTDLWKVIRCKELGALDSGHSEATW